MPISRREICKLGLLGTSNLGFMPLLAAKKPKKNEEFHPWILQVYASGGWDPTLVFDDKVGVESCAQEVGWRSVTSESGIKFVDHPERESVKEFFDRYGSNATIVNGISSGAISQEEAISNMFGTIPDKRFRRCDWLSFYAALLNPAAEMPHVVIDAPYMPGEYSLSTVRLTTSRIAEILDPQIPSLDKTSESALLNFRRKMFRPIASSQNGASLDSEKLLSLYYQFLRNDLSVKNIRKIGATIGTKKPDESDFLHNGKIAIELFRNSYSQCVTLQAGKEREWDTTRDHFSTQTRLFKNLFSDLNQIFAYAKDAGVLERMIVMVISERGRSPVLNSNNGKSPWQFTSALFWGVGIASAKIVGSTDEWLRGKPINPVFDGDGNLTIEMRNIMSGVYLKCGAPAALILPQVQPLSLMLASN